MLQLASGLTKSLIILELLRNNTDLKNIDVHVGTFTNCRECGLTFAVTGFTDNGQYIITDYFTWCVYEHRNSDEIIVNGKIGLISLNGDLPYGEGDKYSYIKAFRSNEHIEAANYLYTLIWNWTKTNARPEIIPIH